MTKINKIASFTDIHWGAQNNSEQHNEDCTQFIEFFCETVKKEKAEAVVFLGDWYEQRNAINGLTLDYSYAGVKLLNDLGIPIKIIVGNHDLFFRHNRSVFTTNVLGSLTNIEIVNEPKVFPEFGSKGALICPFLFPEEYPSLLEYNHVPVWFGHFEFKGYVVTGDTITLDHGPEASDYSKPKKIYTGHFHRRQHFKGTNCYYIGNPFATNFADANDADRGMMIYTFDNDKVKFINYEDGPTFIKTTLTQLMEDPSILKPKATVKCLADTDITLEESANLKEQFTQKYKLRDFKLEEPVTDALKDTDMDLSGLEMESTDKIVVNLLGRITEPKISNDILIKEYGDL